MKQEQLLQRLIKAYFNQPERQITVKAGETVFHQADFNDRLYWVKKGKLTGYFHQNRELSEEGKATKVFTATENTFIGVHSFFAQTWEASTTVIAEESSELAWIDKSTQAVEVEKFGPLTAQFTPVIVNELARRQMRASLEAIEKEKAIQKLYTAEKMTTLGQLAAGIAHELNNAVGVLSSKTERLQEVIFEQLEELHPEASLFLDQGVMYGQTISSSEVRARAKWISKVYGLDRETSKQLARALPEGDIPPHWLDDPLQAIKYWEIGRDLHDMRLASKHSVGIVKSVKQLGRNDTESDEWLDVNDSINKAISLLQSDLRRVNVTLSPAQLPLLRASATELVQIWVNIIKNACDAMSNTTDANIEIVTRAVKNKIVVAISNNGEEIDEATRRKIFQPNFTTKKGGLSFGLGLGLSIVQRIINGYGGSIAVKSEPEKTIFRIKLPVEDGYGKN
ncbi:ATP-binding protein [Vibrio sp. Of7-15]|uniref:ATP-binding protein n=1 Tax=Vibrio sp. Of7-15 TaxID=2724879 RepID=UPI001EF3CDA9|nr:ATP-binding protein [Vibrio sp. Of7-15]MCG7497670.1 ATP-binding protein [Vibrio sp. Of7-15]